MGAPSDPPVLPTPATSPTAPATARSGLVVDGVSAGYDGRLVVRGASFAVQAGSFFTLLGPSGCGKSTLLKVIGGYLAPTQGAVRINGRDATILPPERRNTGMVFQSYALFPHLSARRNVSFGLEVRGSPRAECLDRADAMLARVGITPAERDRLPNQLSGGQQQRVALARALVVRPDLLLLDEPFASLDRHLREHLRRELRDLQREARVTTVLVTHDQEEALALSDAVGVMACGKLLQAGPPVDLYERPATPFVARSLGDANLLDGVLFGHPMGSLVMVRPERCVVGLDAAVHRRRWRGELRRRAFVGPDVVADVVCPGRPDLRVRYRAGARPERAGEIDVAVPDEAVWLVPGPDVLA